MTTLLKTSFFVASLFLLTQCDATKKSTDTSKEIDQMTDTSMSAKMMEEGYKAGTIVYSEAEGDCPYTIEIADDQPSYFLDPVNLDESYKEHGMKIWVKYAGMRMMNRCEKANPVNVIAIEKREE